MSGITLCNLWWSNTNAVYRTLHMLSYHSTRWKIGRKVKFYSILCWSVNYTIIVIGHFGCFFQIFWRERVLAIINQAKIGMIYLLACTSRIESLCSLLKSFNFVCWNWRLKIQKSWFKILNTYLFFLDLFWYPFYPCHLGQSNSFLRETK